MGQYIDTDTLLFFLETCECDGYDKETLSRIRDFVKQQSNVIESIYSREALGWTNSGSLLPEDMSSDRKLEDRMFLIQLSNGRQQMVQRLYKRRSSTVMRYIWTDNNCWYDDDDVVEWAELEV